MLDVACWYFWLNLSDTRWGCLVRFTLSNTKKTKLFQQAWSGLSEAAPPLIPHLIPVHWSSSVTHPHCLAWETHTHTHSSIHRCFWVCVCEWVCFSHMVTSLVCVAVELPSLSSWSSCDPESYSFRTSKTTSGQLSSQSDFTEQKQLIQSQQRLVFVPWFISFQLKGK